MPVFFLSGGQALPRIHLDNYSAVPVDEGDEDRLAGVDDDECGYEGCELDLGDDGGDPGETRRGLDWSKRTRLQNDLFIYIC